MLDKEKISHNFSRAATTYEENAIVQKKMAQLLLQQTQNLSRSFTHILEIGCGTGYLTRLLSKTFPSADIVATDISETMLAQASSLQREKNVRFEKQDGENLTLNTTFDLIISNAAFQWFNNYDAAFSGFSRHLTPEGILLYATFGPATFYELHTAFNQARHSLSLPPNIRHGPPFASSATLADYASNNGLLCHHREETERLYFPSVRSFLSSIKKVGANHTPTSASSGFNRKLLPSMISHYEQLFCTEDGLIPATYHLLFCQVQKSAQPSVNAAQCG